MSVIAFRPFVTVTMDESPSGKAIHAFDFVPTSATHRLLVDHRLVFRPRADGFQLYAQFNPEAGNARLGAFTRWTSFVFGMRLREPDFLTRFHPDLDRASGPNLYLANLDADGSVRTSGRLTAGATVEVADAARIVRRRLNARADLTATPKPASLKITDRFAPSHTVADVPVSADAAAMVATVAFDLSGEAAAVCRLAPQPANTPMTTLFIDDELAGNGAFGALEITAEPSAGPGPAGGRKYSATFRARS